MGNLSIWKKLKECDIKKYQHHIINEKHCMYNRNGILQILEIKRSSLFILLIILGFLRPGVFPANQSVINIVLFIMRNEMNYQITSIASSPSSKCITSKHSSKSSSPRSLSTSSSAWKVFKISCLALDLNKIIKNHERYENRKKKNCLI